MKLQLGVEQPAWNGEEPRGSRSREKKRRDSGSEIYRTQGGYKPDVMGYGTRYWRVQRACPCLRIGRKGWQMAAANRDHLGEPVTPLTPRLSLYLQQHSCGSCLAYVPLLTIINNNQGGERSSLVPPSILSLILTT